MKHIGQHTDDGQRLTIHSKGLADDVWRGLETGPPEAMRDHHNRFTAVGGEVGWLERAADHRLHAKRVKEIV